MTDKERVEILAEALKTIERRCGNLSKARAHQDFAPIHYIALSALVDAGIVAKEDTILGLLEER